MKIRRILKITSRCALTLCVFWLFSLLLFFVCASRCQRNFRQIHDVATSVQNSALDKIPSYRRAEESTYLTFPEWYLVFNPQEYAQWMHERRPSAFPYFGSIGQFWSGYAQVYGLTQGRYPFNAGDHLMEVVIGTSFTAEYLFKGIYENTIGRVAEWTCVGARTEEDDFAARVAENYGAFIPNRPWFEFPFGHAFVDLWKENSFLGKHIVRKMERRLFLSIEYGGKAVYASVIRLASHAVYGVADDEIYLLASEMPSAAWAVPHVRKIQQLSDGSYVVGVPHYQGFTETVPALARAGAAFIDVAGNDEILVTVLAPHDWTYKLPTGSALFTQALYFDTQSKRVALQAPIKALGEMIREFDRQGVRIEHLFDY